MNSLYIFITSLNLQYWDLLVNSCIDCSNSCIDCSTNAQTDEVVVLPTEKILSSEMSKDEHDIEIHD